jgi:hypothetical protein
VAVWAGVVVLAWCLGAAGTEEERAPGGPVKVRPTDILEALWPACPEPVAMLAEVLAGDPRDPDTEWSRKGVSQSRFDLGFLSLADFQEAFQLAYSRCATESGGRLDCVACQGPLTNLETCTEHYPG